MPATDTFYSSNVGLASPFVHAFAITASDSTDLANVTRAIYVGGGGNIALITAGGETVTITGALIGFVYHIRATRVLSTGTSATNLVGLY